jgi:hypothetical protein
MLKAGGTTGGRSCSVYTVLVIIVVVIILTIQQKENLSDWPVVLSSRDCPVAV